MPVQAPADRYRSLTLLNGLTVLTYTDSNLEVADLMLAVRCGYRFERPDELGFAHFLEHMLCKGTKRFPTPELLSGQVERLGGYRNAATSLDHVYYVVQVAAEHTELMTGFLAEMMFESLLDPDRVEQEKGPILQELRRAIGDHQRFIDRRAREVFYEGHPLERTILRTEQSTNDTTSERLRDHMGRLYGADRATLIISSPLPYPQVADLAVRLFGGWGRTTEQVAEQVPFTSRKATRLHMERDMPQTHVSLSYPGPLIGDARLVAAAELATNFLSYGGSSLLMRELRHKRSLVYWVRVENDAYQDAGRVEVSTATEKLDETVAAARSVVESLCDHLRPADLEDLKLQAIGAYKRRFANGNYRVGFLKDRFVEHKRLVTPQEVFGTLQAVTYADIEEFAAGYLNGDQSTLVTLGPVLSASA